MGEHDEVDRFAQGIISKMGDAGALLLATRLTLLVGQRTADNMAILKAATEAVAAIKRMRVIAGFGEL